MRNRKVFVYLLITFAWTWTSWFIGLHYLANGLTQEATNHFIHFFFIGVYGPALGAILTTVYFGGIQETGTLLRKVTFWKARLTVYGVIILAPDLICRQNPLF